MLTGLLCCVAVLQGSFLLFNIGAVFSGFYAAARQSYRFAAADTASEGFRAKAIGWVLFGGVVAGIVGPQLVIATQNLWPPYLFAATYIGQSALALISAGVLMLVNIPKPPARSVAGDGRPLSEIARQPRFVVTVACGVAFFSMMNLVMTSAPLAMVMCNHSVTDATLGLQWHVLGILVECLLANSSQVTPPIFLAIRTKSSWSEKGASARFQLPGSQACQDSHDARGSIWSNPAAGMILSSRSWRG